MPDTSLGQLPVIDNAPHIAVLAFPFSSHAASLLSIVRRLASAAAAPSSCYTSTTFFSFFSTHKSNRSLFPTSTDFQIVNSNNNISIRAYDVPEGYVFLGKPQEEIGLFLKAAPEGFLRGMEAAATDSGTRITCVVADAFFWFAEEMATQMQVPWVAFWTSGPSSLAAHLYTDLIRDKLDVTKGIAGREDETLDFVPGMSKMRVKDLPEGVLFGNLESPFSRMLLHMGRAFPRATAVALNSFEELDPPLTQHLIKSNHVPGLLGIGPLNLLQTEASPAPDEYGCLSWLDRQRAPVTYIGFGSVTVPPRDELIAIAEALEASGTPFLWSLKKEFWVGGYLPEGFLDRTSRTTQQGMVVPWAPQVDILSHDAVGAFVTHCGWSSFLEGIAGGVPMICRPFFGDQRLNGRTIQDVLEIGVMVEGGVIMRDSLVRSLSMTLSGEKGERMRENVKNLRKQAIEALRGPTGSSAANFDKLLKIVMSTRRTTPPLVER